MKKRKPFYSRKLYNEHILTIAHESHSIAEWARRNGVNYETVMVRIRRGHVPEMAVRKRCPRLVGMTMERWRYLMESVKKPQRKKRIAKRYQITIDGVTKSARQWAKVNGLQYSTVIRRVRDGFTLLEAVTLSTDEGKSRIPFLHGKIPNRITFEGQTHTLVKWARISGMKYRLMRDRLLNGWSFKEVMWGRRGPWYAKKKRVMVNLRERRVFTPLKQS